MAYLFGFYLTIIILINIDFLKNVSFLKLQIKLL